MTVKEDQENVRRSLSLRENRKASLIPVESPSLQRRKSHTNLRSKKSFTNVTKTPPRPQLSKRRLNSRIDFSSPSTPTTLSPLINHPDSKVLLPLRATSKNKGNRPDGSEDTPLGPRGAPDGSECNLRDTSPPEDAIYALEKQYIEIKSAVQNMENEIDRNNINDMKQSLMQNNSSTLSSSQIVNDAYERMKMETRDLSCSPAENLTKRLGRELRIRSRRSGEPRVIRSPSERKIGSIRRRSKELEQQQQATKLVLDEISNKMGTPKFKGNLVQSPQTSLRRGRPNSLKSGLPMVVKPANTVGLPGVVETPPKGIQIAKRSTPLTATPKTRDSDCSSRPSRNSVSESFSASFSSTYNGPITRRRSSSLGSNTVLPISLNLTDLSVASAKNSLGGAESNIQIADNSFVKNQTNLSKMGTPENSEDSIEWVSATDFMEQLHIEHHSERDTPYPGGNRPSIAALKKQKKVTANVQLFSQLQGPSVLTPSSCRRSTRFKVRTPVSSIPPRNIASERRHSTRARIKNRLVLTPQQYGNAIAKSTIVSPRTPKIAIISPMKTRSSGLRVPRLANYHDVHPVKRLKRMGTFIIPSTLSPLPPKPSFKVPLTPQFGPICTETPPRLPPRNISLSAKK